jgi:dienelactone hydrolase
LWSPLTLAADVQVLFNLESPTGGPFPSDLFTVTDPSHNTGLRINLPKPDCAARPSDCADIDVINTLDGFNVQPRLSIPFSGPIDVNTVTSETVFLVSLGSTLLGGNGGGQIVGINQVVWDPTTNTLFAESDELLDQHTGYALIVTNGVHDTVGDPIEVSEVFARFRHDLNFGQTKDPALKAYRKALLNALQATGGAGIRSTDIVAVSVFTTQSVTAILEKIRDQIKEGTPEPANFLLGPGGTRTVFPLSDVTGITFNRQVSTAPTFSASPVPLGFLGLFPSAVGQLAFGKYLSPDYETAEQVIPPIGTFSGTPAVQRTNEIFFNLFLPSGPQPTDGWPVAIFGHGTSLSKNDVAFAVAATLAAHGIATVAINAVGHGNGPLSTLTVNQTVGDPMTFSAGGRGIDQNSDGNIGSTEGLVAAPPDGLIRQRDGLRQTVVDLMQLVRVIEVGIDVDGDGASDLDPARIYYFGQSLGGQYGTLFLAVESSVRAGVPIVPGGPFSEIVRLSPPNRPLLGIALASRVPPLINIGGIMFNENLPLRDQPPIINDVPGAIAIQEFFEHRDWVQQSGDAVAYAPYLRKQPLDGTPAKSVIIQFAKGDQTVPNPTTTALLRAGDLADRATFYRHDLAFNDPLRNPNPPGTAVPKDPHGFFAFSHFFPAVADVGLGAQQQIAEFFASDGETIIDPDGPDGPLFEVPIVPPLPEELNFIP